MRKKNGFTLAEVLVTLGIIGVVSALTIPSMTQDVQKQKIGPTLAKAVNTLENANANLLQYKEARNLVNACEVSASNITRNYIYCLANESNITGFITTGNYTYNNLKYDTCIQTKDGIAFCTGNSALSTGVSSRQYDGRAINIAIDINGPENKPNKFSKDVFSFKVDLQGQLIATGSKQERNYFGQGGDALWKNTCNSSQVTDSLDCAGSIVDNGWKVIYQY